MKNKLMNLTILCFFLCLVCLIFIYNKTIVANINSSIELWATKVLPSLFPMFVISDILIAYGLADVASKYLTPLTKKLFKVDGNGAYVIIMSLLSGCPSNAYIVENLIKKGKISSSVATKVLCFSFFSNPLFLLGILSNIFPNQNTLVLKIIIVHYLTNIIIGILIKNYQIKEANLNQITINFEKSPKEFGIILSKSISRSITTLTMILGTIIFYTVISTAIIQVLNPPLISSTLIKGSLEITQGLNNLINIHINDKIKAIIAVSIISFGGISIHNQVKSIIYNTNISYKAFLIARLIHAFIASLILLLII